MAGIIISELNRQPGKTGNHADVAQLVRERALMPGDAGSNPAVCASGAASPRPPILWQAGQTAPPGLPPRPGGIRRRMGINPD